MKNNYLFRLSSFCAFVLIVGLSTYVHTFWGDLKLYISLYGFSAVDFSNYITEQDNFLLDYPGGAGTTGKKSFLSWLYPMLAVFDVSPLSTMYGMIFLEISTLFIGVLALCNVLSYRNNYLFIFISIITMGFSWARYPDLSNFSSPYFHGQFYGFADGLILLAIALTLSGRKFGFFIPLTLSFLVHPIKTTFGYFSVLTLQVFDWVKSKKLDYLQLSIFILSIIISVCWLLIFVFSENGQPMSQKEFFEYSKLLNFHWYPERIGLLGDMYYRYIIPYLSAMLAFSVVVLKTQALSQNNKIKLIYIVIGLNLISIVGLANSYLELSATLTKSALHRGSVLTLGLVTILFINELVHDLKNKKYLFFILEVSILTTLFFTKTSWSLYLVSIYALLYSVSSRKEKKTAICVLLALGVLLGLDFIFSDPALNLDWHYAQQEDFVLNMIYFALAFFIFKALWSFFPIKSQEYLIISWCLSLFLIISAYSWSLSNRLLKPSVISSANDYLAAQLWAKENTRESSLFMTDPCFFGWRDWSERSSFGVIQEWLKTGWLYTGNSKWLYEGLERARLLGLTDRVISNYEGSHSSKTYIELCKIAKSEFYSSTFNFKYIKNKYGVDYIVTDRIVNNKQVGNLVYSNNGYFIYELK